MRRHDGRVVGHVRGHELVLVRRRSKHWLRQLDGWSFDAVVLAQAAVLGATHVVVIDRDTGTTYRTALATFGEHGVPVAFGGHGKQVALGDCHWEKSGTMQLRLEV